MKHWIITPHLGELDSSENLKQAYRGGLVSIDDLAPAVVAHRVASDDMKSPQPQRSTASASGIFSMITLSRDLERYLYERTDSWHLL